MPKAPSFAAAALAAGISVPALAGNSGFFTTYDSHVEKGELELMVMNDFTESSLPRREEGRGDTFSQMLELEYGLSSRFATEFMVEWFSDMETHERKFTGFRWENRFRLFKDPVPFNPMVYAEYEALDLATRYKMEVSGWVLPPYEEEGEEPFRESILETRLVLSNAGSSPRLAFNWINETDLDGNITAFGYSAGAMWHPGHGAHGQARCPMHPEKTGEEGSSCPVCGMELEGGNCSCDKDMAGCLCGHCKEGKGECPCHGKGSVAFGLEVFGALGDSKAFDAILNRQEHYLGPILVCHPTSRLMVHMQVAIGLSHASDNLTRLNLGYEF